MIHFGKFYGASVLTYKYIKLAEYTISVILLLYAFKCTNSTTQ